jgi:hypothetical protein
LVDAGGQRGRLPEVATQLDDVHARILRRDRQELLHGAIGAAVVDKDEFDVAALEHFREPRVHLIHVQLFIVNRHNDGDRAVARRRAALDQDLRIGLVHHFAAPLPARASTKISSPQTGRLRKNA